MLDGDLGQGGRGTQHSVVACRVRPAVHYIMFTWLGVCVCGGGVKWGARVLWGGGARKKD
jgi:hypothetical protein